MAVNCRQCKHYFITWDKKFPYGCKAFVFKTSKMPSVEVFNSSGTECKKFIIKETIKK